MDTHVYDDSREGGVVLDDYAIFSGILAELNTQVFSGLFDYVHRPWQFLQEVKLLPSMMLSWLLSQFIVLCFGDDPIKIMSDFDLDYCKKTMNFRIIFQSFIKIHFYHFGWKIFPNFAAFKKASYPKIKGWDGNIANEFLNNTSQVCASKAFGDLFHRPLGSFNIIGSASREK